MQDEKTNGENRAETSQELASGTAGPPAPGQTTDEHLGAVETDKPGQTGQGNPNVPALDENGQPADWKKICEDVIGANVDESEGG